MDRKPERNPNEGLVKVRLPLLGAARESGFEFESVWAEPMGDNEYRIWNLPVFSYNVEMRAIVECGTASDGGLPIATRLVQQGDCIGFRFYFAESATDQQVDGLLDLLSEARAVVEKFNNRLWAVGFRRHDDFDRVRPVLDRSVKEGVLTVETVMQRDEPTIAGAV